MLEAENRRANSVERWDGRRTEAMDPILHFFMGRCREAYVRELDDFIDALEQGRPCEAGAVAGVRGLRIDRQREDPTGGKLIHLAVRQRGIQATDALISGP
ncbi:MAG: hypothetical protein U1E52_19045 [Geminicoccaceae bacterium]